ncbi:unnamed protein product [Periconia digitata]|uniref:Uncharacterized protein n=1 Tax=Periconia digitata TaxID=1303443 RepID=A0A9W4URM7_9PLEO|nr:unnamed protein product [Periconia digitata]
MQLKQIWYRGSYARQPILISLLALSNTDVGPASRRTFGIGCRTVACTQAPIHALLSKERRSNVSIRKGTIRDSVASQRIPRCASCSFGCEEERLDQESARSSRDRMHR